jgi:hypothetical protein
VVLAARYVLSPRCWESLRIVIQAERLLKAGEKILVVQVSKSRVRLFEDVDALVITSCQIRGSVRGKKMR